MTPYDYDYFDTFQNWDDPLNSDGPCPYGGVGNYVLLDSSCDWQCRFRKACMAIKKRAQQERQGEIWRRLFSVDRLNLVREQIISEVNEHQHFISLWKKVSFRERCRIENKKLGGLSAK